MIIMIVMMTYIDFQIALRLFNLILDIPERVSRWFGEGGDRLGDDDHAKQTTNLFAANIENRASSLATGLGKNRAIQDRGKGQVEDASGAGQTPGAGGPPVKDNS